MFCDGFTGSEPVLVIETCIDCASGYGAAEMEDIEVALVMNDMGQHWVPFDNLADLDEVINDSR
tara:strand:+ start:304 stop:495 length:192 start_codon:yes stop_codon:yes gene_type:complete